ncbi:class I SAM-dependent DNA methyltransferase [Frankia sp. B2]|uniref:hypothetical protein n=1 Tax=unclassified Frankia TaxID=2632575 RepID=UPI000460EF15|nr:MULTISPECIES: hypothetical protein [unclassified Frankia]KDA44277.1 hypothetical protein BMG523Draft_00775 [Frankia sp. BMG5.23]TFE29140.1 class I SAM-dependent DNA methyltransferase [Frankia sp. B2]
MSFEALTNRGEYLSPYYLTEVLPQEIRKTAVPRWADQEKAAASPRTGVRRLRSEYFARKPAAVGVDGLDAEHRRKELLQLHDEVLAALGFEPRREVVTVTRAGSESVVPVVYAGGGLVDDAGDGGLGGGGVVAVECAWAADIDAAADPDGGGKLLDPVQLDNRERIEHGTKLASHLFAADRGAPRYVLILNGGVVTLADRHTWSEGRYLAVSFDVAFARNDTRPGGELDVIAALFGADALRPPPQGGPEPLAELVAGSRRQAAGVSSELREGLRLSVEHIAGEVLARLRDAGIHPEEIMAPDELGRQLTRESLRYLYRILFLLYAEARPELGVLPAEYPEYVEGYSLARLGDLVARRRPTGDDARNRFYLYESLDLLFTMVNTGYRPVDGQPKSDGEGLRFEPLRSELFATDAVRLISRALPVPAREGTDGPTVDTRLRNGCLYEVLRLLMLTRGKKGPRRGKGRRGGFISYAQLGINQLGAVYEGLMSYTGFIASEELYEVAKGGDPADGSWMVPASKIDEYADEVFVRHLSEETGRRTGPRVRYPKGSFVYRLAGRDRQTSASYYTPPSLTEVTVQLALRHRLDQNGTKTRSRELLDWTICEPALGSGAFLNEAINQVAAEYLKRAQHERQERLDPERYAVELQRTKAYIALHNSYGVDLNSTAVELAEISLWLNVMHAGLQAPWFGLHLRRGNSLIGAGRRLYPRDQLADRAWLHTAPTDHPFRAGELPPRTVHHFLLPADGWGAVAKEPEAKALAPNQAKALAAWRRSITKSPATKGKVSPQVRRLEALARRVEFLWGLVRQRLEISEAEIRRDIKVWGAGDLPPVDGKIPRDKVRKDLDYPGTPFWRLKTLMDVWCALWFWPLDKAGMLDGSADEYAANPIVVTRAAPEPPADPGPVGQPATWESRSIFEEDQQIDPDVAASTTSTAPRNAPRPDRKLVERLRRLVPLATLDDWLAFAEALIGRNEIPDDAFVSRFTTLDELEEYENELAPWVGQDEPTSLAERFPWLATAEEIADRRGFFHWEVEFAQAFARGGFDLQVGNPPWVRPRWEENVVLAEHDPWFMLNEAAGFQNRRTRKDTQLDDRRARESYLAELSANAAMVASLASPATYPLLAGSQPNLYRAFMIQVWRHASPPGISGLIHPDSHFAGAQEVTLRAATYHHLRLHGHFQNQRLIFPEIDWSRQFGVQIYGHHQPIHFQHLSWLFGPETLTASLDHDGSGPLPGIKYDGTWDLRPHTGRIVTVTDDVLTDWMRLTGESDHPPDTARLLYPVTVEEQSAIGALTRWAHRLGQVNPRISSGYHESGAKKARLIEEEFAGPKDWSEVVLRGPQFSLATPVAKQPPRTGRYDEPVDPRYLDAGYVPTTDYRRATDIETFRAAQDRWLDHAYLEELRGSPAAVNDARRALAAAADADPVAIDDEAVAAYLRGRARRPYTDFFRVAWRRRIANNTFRSHFVALIPPGPAHIHAVHSMSLDSNRETALTAGFWSALAVDYFVRVTGRSDLEVTDANILPAPIVDHPLAGAILLRTLRLNCLTSAYAPLWSEVFDQAWGDDGWVIPTPNTPPLGDVRPEWDVRSPLRTELARRAALVELDALVSVMMNISADQLAALYLARFPQLQAYEEDTWFDLAGRKICGDRNSFGFGQAKEHYVQLRKHLEDPRHEPPPEGYAAPFHKADREAEMRQAHAAFSARLRAARDAGWREPEPPESGG